MSYSYSTITDLSPLLETLGNRPVLSENIWPDTSTGCIHTRFSRAGFSMWIIPSVIIGWCMGWGGGARGGWALVERMCWSNSLRFPLEVSMDLGRCLRTSLDVKPVQVVKYPTSMALHQVSTTGLKQDLCSNCTRANGVFMCYALLLKT